MWLQHGHSTCKARRWCLVDQKAMTRTTHCALAAVLDVDELHGAIDAQVGALVEAVGIERFQKPSLARTTAILRPRLLEMVMHSLG